MLEQLQTQLADPQRVLAALLALGVVLGAWLMVRLALISLEGAGTAGAFARPARALRVLWGALSAYLALIAAVYALRLDLLEPLYGQGESVAAWFGASIGRSVATVALAYLALLGVEVLVGRIVYGSEFNRRSVRTRTLKGILRSSLRGVVYILAGIQILQALGVEATTLVAGVSIIGVAVSFGAQSLIRDFLNGFIILLEDQYGVGDVITVNGNPALSGGVERITLRVTQLRALDGSVHLIPNGQINSVSVASKGWSRLVGDVLVSLDADIDAALECLRQVADALYTDPQYKDIFLEAPRLEGIVNLDNTGVKIRALFKVQPKEQWALGREFNLRVKHEFRRARVLLAGESAATIALEPEGES